MTTSSTRLDEATTALLAGSLRELFAAGPDASAVASALSRLGWEDVEAQDPITAVTLLFTEQGRSLAATDLLDSVVRDALGDPAAEAAAGVVYLCGETGVLLRPYRANSEIVALCEDGTGRLLPAGALSPSPLDAFETVPGRFVTPVGTAGTALPRAASERAVAAARRALSAELIGVCQAALDLALEHTTARVQYGRQLATFQAVRHRLAEAHVAVEAARATLDASWSDGGGWAARVAKVHAGQAQEQVTRTALQVFGAMGLTLESPLHRHVTRAAFLDRVLGGHQALAERIGADLLAGAEPARLVTIG